MASAGRSFGFRYETFVISSRVLTQDSENKPENLQLTLFKIIQFI